MCERERERERAKSLPALAGSHGERSHSRRAPCGASPPRPPDSCSLRSGAGWPGERCPAWGEGEREMRTEEVSLCTTLKPVIRGSSEGWAVVVGWVATVWHSHTF